jgi:hypothetical protein
MKPTDATPTVICMTRRYVHVLETLVVLVSLLVIGGIAVAIWQVSSGHVGLGLLADLAKLLLTGKVVKIVAAAIVIIATIVVSVRKRLSREPHPTSGAGAGAVEVPEQRDLGPVMDHLPVDVQKKSS